MLVFRFLNFFSPKMIGKREIHLINENEDKTMDL